MLFSSSSVAPFSVHQSQQCWCSWGDYLGEVATFFFPSSKMADASQLSCNALWHCLAPVSLHTSPPRRLLCGTSYLGGRWMAWLPVLPRSVFP